jgi:hypothetical protein
VHVLEGEQLVARPLEQVFELVARDLERIFDYRR